MAFPFAPILGAAGALPGAITSIAGLFDNSANRAVHERNKARVRQINFQNSLIRGDNLKIRSDFNARKLSVLENIDNIQLASDQARGRARLGLDRATRQSMLGNQKDVRRMFQSLSSRQGTMNVGNRQALLDYSAAATARANKLTQVSDDLITSEYDARLAQQNAVKLQKERVAMMPQYKQYIRNYEPEQYQNDMTQRVLGAVGGLAGAAVTGFETFDKFKVPTDLDGYNPGVNSNLKIGKFNPNLFDTSFGYGRYAK
jgi:hypothetical protein|tara:strand:+ start:51 stop:824 length:774 start_codon:yes stop_codon:yes gene_type:complete